MDIAALLIEKMCERGELLTIDFLENVSLQRGVRESLLLIIDKAMRRFRTYRRLQVVWMSSDIDLDESNILNILPMDLCRSVSKFI